MKALIPAAVYLALLAGPAAAGAATWTEPERLTPSPSTAGNPTLVYSRVGRPLITWGVYSGHFAHDQGELGATAIASPQLDGWAPTYLPEPLRPAVTNLDELDKFLVAGTVSSPGTVGAVGVRAWTGDAPVTGPPVVNGTPALAWDGSVEAIDGDAGPGGEAAMAWYGRRRGRTETGPLRLYASTRRPGVRRFRRPLQLGTQTGASEREPLVAATVTRRGGAAFAWPGGNAIYARAVSSSGRPGRRLTVGRAQGGGSVAAIAPGPARALTVVWTRASGAYATIVTAHSRDGRRFGPARVIDSCFIKNGCEYPQAAAGPDGEMLVAWPNLDGAQDVIRAVELRGGRGTVRELDRTYYPYNGFTRVVIDQVGRAAVGWSTALEVQPTGIYVATRLPDGRFGPAEFVRTPDVPPEGPVLAFDPSAGQPRAVFWTAQDADRYDADERAVYLTARRP